MRGERRRDLTARKEGNGRKTEEGESERERDNETERTLSLLGTKWRKTHFFEVSV
jgi:hypothetical protein